MASDRFRLPAWADRTRDRPARRPPDLLHGLEDWPQPLQGLALALQQVALQSVYWLLPGLAATAYGLGPEGAMGMICLCLVATAVGGVLHGLWKGPVGSGYALPNVPTPVMLGSYLAAASAGISFAAAGATLTVAALLVLALFLAVPRLLGLIPAELSGVVVFMIGVSLLPRALDLALRSGGRMPQGQSLLLMLGIVGLMVVAVILRWPLSRFAVILGGAVGCGLALALTEGSDGSQKFLAAAPWFALPRPVLPDFTGITPGLLLVTVVGCLCCLPSWLGDLLTFQRTLDAGWTRPDPAPLRRGVVAGLLSMALSGLFGGFGAGTSSACVGLAVSTRSLSRVITFIGSGILLLLACSPKLVALFVLMPGPVAAAMVAFVGCFMLAGGTALMTARVLDPRRTCCVGMGLAAGLMALARPDLFLAYMPQALVSPVTLSFCTAFLLHLLTLPMVKRRTSATVTLEARSFDAFVQEMAGLWALRRATADTISHALLELAEILMARGLEKATLRASFTDGLVRVTIMHEGPVLPTPSMRPRAEDLAGSAAAQESFAMWLAAREAVECHRRSRNGVSSVTLEFRD